MLCFRPEDQELSASTRLAPVDPHLAWTQNDAAKPQRSSSARGRASAAALLPPSRKRRRLSALSGFFSFLLIAAVVALLAVVLGEHRLREPGPLTADKVVFIQKGGTDDIVERLAEQGVVESPFAVRMALFSKMLQGDKESLKSGEYLFKQEASMRRRDRARWSRASRSSTPSPSPRA